MMHLLHRLYGVDAPAPTYGRMTRHPLSTDSIIALHLLDFMVQGKITEADAPKNRLDATPTRLSVAPPPSSPIFMPNGLSAATLQVYPGLGQAPSNAGFHSQWLGLQ